MADILAKFKEFFGARGGLKIPGNVGGGRNVAELCGEAFAIDRPALFDYLAAWHELDDPSKRPENENAVGLLQAARHLQDIGQWEGSWALLQIHFDQTQKQEISNARRENKGDSLCGLAILGQPLGSHALVRHYAQLSSAGDVYYEHVNNELRHGGLGPTILERYESRISHQKWREYVRQKLKVFDPNEPLYLEPFLAVRWFAPKYSERFMGLAKCQGRVGKPFVDVLLENVEMAEAKDDERGTRFEAAAGICLSLTPGFEVRSCRSTTDEQTDLVVQYAPDPLSRLLLPAGPGLVECKASGDRIGVPELRDFGAKCLFHRVGFGILIARMGVTGSGLATISADTHAELVRRRFQVDGLTLLVLDISQLREKSRDLRGLQDVLAADHDRLVFGPIAGEASKLENRERRPRR